MENPNTPENKYKENITMKNRERNERIEIRLTEEERTIFEQKMKMAKCKTMSNFIRKCVMESNIYIVDLQPIREIQGLLFRYASNLNQIAKRVNSTGLSIVMTSKICNPKLNTYQKKCGIYILCW